MEQQHRRQYLLQRIALYGIQVLAIFGVPQNLLAAGTWSPEKSVEISVPGGAGGGIDTQARTVQQILHSLRLVEAPIVVVNKPGGSASIGLTYISRQTPNGLYIAMGSSALLTNYIAGTSTLHYTDVTPLPQLARESIAFSVRAESPIKSGQDLLRRFRQDTPSVKVGLPSIASSNHIASALMVKAVNANPKQLSTVVFNSSAQAITALLGGHIDVVACPILTTVPHLKRGVLRVIAITAPKRLQGEVAGIPTARELGADVVIGAYRNVLGPKGMAADKVNYWDEVFARMVATPEWQRFMQNNFWEDHFMRSSESAAFLKERNAAFQTVLSELGLVKAVQ